METNCQVKESPLRVEHQNENSIELIDISKSSVSMETGDIHGLSLDGPTISNHSPSSSPHSNCIGSSARLGKRKIATMEHQTDNLYEEFSQEVENAKERLTNFLVEKSIVVEILEEGRRIVDEILLAKMPVAVDCEGVNLGDRRSGRVTLIQVGDQKGNAYLFDVLVEPALAKELQRLLETETIIKVMHDCRADSEGLYNQFGIQIKEIFDTQSAHIVIRQSSQQYTNADKNIGLDQICSSYGGVPNQFKDKIKGVYKKDQRFWSHRPLTPLMISYAASDVLCLVPTVYNELNRLISSEEDKKQLEILCDKQITHTQNKHTNNQNHAIHNNKPQSRHYSRQYNNNFRGRGRGRGSGGGGYY